MDTRLVTREQMEARANEVAELLKTAPAFWWHISANKILLEFIKTYNI
ncbi:hypothetical protein C066_03058 [Brucella sp. UK5/01]|nr:hypothetical protein C066_03058 [Brucella sp. UK5/01]